MSTNADEDIRHIEDIMHIDDVRRFKVCFIFSVEEENSSDMSESSLPFALSHAQTLLNLQKNTVHLM